MCGSVDANGKVHFTTILYTYTYDSLSMGYVAVLNAHPLIIDMHTNIHSHMQTHMKTRTYVKFLGFLYVGNENIPKKIDKTSCITWV